VSEPLKMAHADGVQVAGSGINLKAGLARAHENGAQISGHIPTPGAPNQYAEKNQ
jgi:hypothetical protein